MPPPRDAGREMTASNGSVSSVNRTPPLVNAVTPPSCSEWPRAHRVGQVEADELHVRAPADDGGDTAGPRTSVETRPISAIVTAARAVAARRAGRRL
jgi:hypothetical protein